MKKILLILTVLPLFAACDYKLTGHVPEIATQERADEQIDIDRGAAADGSVCSLKEQNQGICRN